MTSKSNTKQRTIQSTVLVLVALLVSASQPLFALDQAIERTTAPAPVSVWIWVGPGIQVVLTVVDLPAEAPQPSDDTGDKNGVILEDGAPF